MSKEINKDLVRQRFLKGLATYAEHAVVQRQMAERLLHEFKPFAKRSYCRVLEIGCGAGLLTEQLLESFAIGELLINDLVPECEDIVTSICNEYATKSSFFSGDIETETLPMELDLVVSNAAFQWLVKPDRFLAKIRNCLKPGGYFIFTSFGPDNLKETAELTEQKLSYPSLADLATLIGKEFEVVYSSEQLSQMSFETPRAVLKHLRKTGVTGISSQQWTKTMLQEFCSKYQEKYSTDSGVSLTYHPIFIIARS